MAYLVGDVSVAAVGLMVFLSFSRAVATHFASPRMPAGMKIISAVSIVACLAAVSLTFSFTQPIVAQLLGLALMVAAGVLFGWAVVASRPARLRLAFDRSAPSSLLEVGPYAYIRHPLYSSYTVFWIGWGIACWSLIALIPIVILITLYAAAAAREERSFAQTDLADEYEAYRTRTGAFFPRCRCRHTVT